MDDSTTLEDLKAIQEVTLLYCEENDLEIFDAEL